MDEDEARRSPRRRLLLFGGLIVVAAVALVGWNRVAASPRLCSSCHSMEAETYSAQRSVHADLPCLACHTGPGLAGAVRYVPTLAREVAATVTGWNLAHGVLKAAPCESCHEDLTTAPALKAAHSGDISDCASCHGDVTHPQPPLESRAASAQVGYPHPDGWVQTHGSVVAQDPNSCETCHRPEFCQACHFKSTFPHPANWIPKHGLVEERKGIESCTLCHPSTFCAGCHGTEIPHRSDWLGEHWRALQDASASPCLVCHPQSDCTTCHAEHGVHDEQSLFASGGG